MQAAIPYIALALTAASTVKTLTAKNPSAQAAAPGDTSGQDAILARQEKQAGDEKARLAGEQMARSRAAKRGGGFRSLLSEQRLNPETGLPNTLGPS